MFGLFKKLLRKKTKKKALSPKDYKKKIVKNSPVKK